MMLPAAVIWLRVALVSSGCSDAGLGQAEVQDLQPAIGGDEQVLRLDVAMDDSLGMRRPPGPAAVWRAYSMAFCRGRRSTAQPLPQRLALEQFRDQIRTVAFKTGIENGEDVGVVQRTHGTCFGLEAAQAVGIRCEHLR